MIIVSFLFFLLVFVVIGAASMVASKHTTNDYLTAGQSIKPWLVALSAVATNNSGYMFTGMIGFTYVNGLPSIWLMIGWIAGDYLGSLSLWRSIRERTEQHNLDSFSGLISQWWGQRYTRLQRLSGLLILIFLGTYAGAQLNAGSKALHVLLDWELSTGVIIGATMVLIYSFAGGIRASIWTDAAQSAVMIVAMPLLMWLAINHLGGWSETMVKLHQVEGGYMNWFMPGSTPWSAALFVVGWIFAGFGVVGQPHVMVRYMSLTDGKLINRVRAYYYSWFIFFYGATIIVGLMARLIIPDAAEFDSELALPTIAVELIPGLLAGLVLAGLFAATMSTADSLVLSCSASVSRDLRPDRPLSYMLTKIATLVVVVIALLIALYGNDSVFELVILAWGLLASAFAPLMLIYRFRRLPTEWASMAIMLTGVIAYLLSHYTVVGEHVYELVPSMLASLVAYLLALALGKVKTIDKTAVTANL